MNIKKLIVKELNKVKGVAPLATPWDEVLLTIASLLNYDCEEDGSGVLTPWGWNSWSDFYDGIMEEVEKILNKK